MTKIAEILPLFVKMKRAPFPNEIQWSIVPFVLHIWMGLHCIVNERNQEKLFVGERSAPSIW
jgi:hypothetical protein